ncbi:serpin family protein [Breznakia pachnodae]|uniref:Serpin B n=1 Tax=Breznakia pachnodae TaxID=265178 RepID=A0ABU0E2J5_9FIRM|nr:serpin family protein [Breznakia pachnodae]MDQ0360923.1 serpin B [Breznakia pachnodae]
MKHKRYIITTALASLLLISGCSDNNQSAYNDSLLKAKSITIDTKEIDEQFQNSYYDMSLSLLKQQDLSDSNLISPLSIYTALGMTMNGADGDTLEEMEQVFGLSSTDMNQYLSNYSKNLGQYSSANSIWLEESFAEGVKQDFLNENFSFYSSEVYKTAMDDKSTKEINNWVSDNTNEKIKKIVGKLDGSERMILINAIAFDAKWETPYETIEDGIFTNYNGDSQDTSYLSSDESKSYINEKMSSFTKTYEDGKYAFIAVLPSEEYTIDEYVNQLDSEQLSQIIKNQENREVYTQMPKFEQEQDYQLINSLKNLGIVSAFSDSANFSRMSDNGNLQISEIRHKTYINVDEEGTQASAATSVTIKETAAMVEENEDIILNRPFLYMIVDVENDIPIFIGTVNEL